MRHRMEMLLDLLITGIKVSHVSPGVLRLFIKVLFLETFVIFSISCLNYTQIMLAFVNDFLIKKLVDITVL